MRHAIFFETIAKFDDEAPEWDVLAVGYATMRLVDDFLRVGPVGIANDKTTARTLARLDEIADRFPEATIEALRSIVRALLNASEASPRPVAPALFVYAQLLQHEGHWRLAKDVYQTVAESFEFLIRPTSEDLSFAADARRKEGFCLRYVQEYVEAERAYKQAIMLAKEAGNDVIYLQGELGLATMIRHLGNLPDAEKALDMLLSQCETCDPEAARLIRPDILHTRGVVKQDRGLFQEAIVDLFTAYKTSTVADNRETILADLGNCACDAGYHTAARDALGIVSLTASQPFAKQLATVNLMYIATQDNNRTEFDRRRHLWRPEHCDPLLNSTARLYIAYGLEKFGTHEEAREAFREAVRFAEEAKNHKIAFEALRELKRLEQGTAIDSQLHTANPIPESLTVIAEELSQTYILALTEH